MMEETPETILDMEEKLKKDASGTYRKEIGDQLSEYSTRLKRALDSGLPPDEFQAINRLKNAVDEASKVVEGVWNSIHK